MTQSKINENMTYWAGFDLSKEGNKWSDDKLLMPLDKDAAAIWRDGWQDARA